MKTRRDFDDILDDCLERLRQGERVEECAARYPPHSAELVPLLEVAATTMQAAASVPVRWEAKSRGLNRLGEALAQRSVPSGRRFGWPGWRRRVASPLVIALVAAMLATGTAFGATVASSDSVPGDSLYWVKTTRENLSLMVPRSDRARANEHIHLARVRGLEMGRLMQRGRLDAAEETADRMRRHLNRSAVFIGLITPTNPVEMPVYPARLRGPGGAAELIRRLERDGGSLRVRLSHFREPLPLRDRSRVDLLRRRSELSYRILIAALEGSEDPTWRPLWRVKPAGWKSRRPGGPRHPVGQAP